MILGVRIFGDPVLRTRAEEISTPTEVHRELVENMVETMHENRGVGLAANQVGVLERVFVYDCDGISGHIINPVWEALDEETLYEEEGCLSIPDVKYPVTRHAKVRVTGVDVDNNPIDFVAEGLLARCVQHETDHLDGVLFLKRLTPELRKEAMGTIRNSEWFNQ